MSRRASVVLSIALQAVACGNPSGNRDALGAFDVSDASDEADVPDAPVPTCSAPTDAIGSWRRLPALGAPATAQAVLWTGTDVLAVDWSTAPRIDAYDPANDRWRSIPVGTGAPSPRSYPFVGFAAGQLVIFGGYVTGPSQPLTSGGVLNLASGTWTALPDGTVPDLVPNSHGSGGIAWGTSILFLSRVGARPHPVAAVFDMSAGAFTHIEPATASGYDGCDAPASDGANVVCNDLGNEYLHVVAPYALMPLPAIPASAFDHVWHAGWLGGALWIWGGSVDVANNPTYLAVPYDPATASWAIGVPSPIARADATVGVLNGRMLVWGGVGYAPDVMYGAEPRSEGAVFDPVSRSWSAIPCAPIDPGAQTANVSAVSTDREWILLARGVLAAFRF